MKAKIASLVRASLHQFLNESDMPEKIHIERTRDSKHGDFACNTAMALAKTLKINPQDLGKKIISHLPVTAEIKQVAMAGPGFINFHLTDQALQQIIAEIIKQDGIYGQSSLGAGKKAIVEFVSANPTGPLHVGHGRHAAYGATVANLLEAVGYKVHREYYVNDAGRQMHILAISIWLRYLELLGESITFPRNGYVANYVIDVAKVVKSLHQEKFLRPIHQIFQDLPLDETEDGQGDKEIYIDALISRTKNLLGNDYEILFNLGLKQILTDIHEDLAEFGITFQEWFSEKSLENNGDVQNGIDQLHQNHCIYVRDGATWFQATSYGDEKDRVVIRDNGQATYFASDVGYHLNKFERGFDLMVDIFGADHHGYAPELNLFYEQ